MVQPKLNKIHISFFVAFFLHFLHYFLRANVLPPSQFSVLGGMVPRIARIHFQLTWIELAPFHTEFRLSRVDLCVPQSPPRKAKFISTLRFNSFHSPPPPPGAAGEYMKQLPLPGGLPAEQFDYFHEMIAHEEYARTGCPGFCDGMGGGVGAAGGASCL